MLRAWREVFLAERQTVTTPGGGEVALRVELDQADPETLVAILGLSTRATNALDRVGVTTVRQLLDLPVGDVRFMRGVGKKTRDEIIAALDQLRKRFPKPPDGGRPEGRPAPSRGPGDARPRRPAAQAAGRRRRARRPTRRSKIRELFLGLGSRPAGDWPSQSDVAMRLD